MKPQHVELWLARHGVTAWNLDGRLLGSTDVGLAPEGEAQAAALGARLRGVAFDSVWSSDRLRAVATARRAHGPAREDVRLRELDFGALEGGHFAALSEELRDAYLGFDAFAAPGGESVSDLRRRVLEFVRDQAPGRHLVVTHGGVVRVLLDELGHRSFVGPASLTIVDWSHRRILALEPTPATSARGSAR